MHAGSWVCVCFGVKWRPRGVHFAWKMNLLVLTTFSFARCKLNHVFRTGNFLTTFCRNGNEIAFVVVEKNEFTAAEGMSSIRRKYASNLVFLFVKR